MKRTTFNVLFWVFKSRAKEGRAPIYARITVNGQKVDFGVKRTAPLELWDAKAGKAIGKLEEARQINHFLELIRKNIFDAYQDLLIEKAELTAKTIRDRYLGIEEKPEDKKLLELVDYHNERNRNVLEWGTLKNYFTTRKYIELFITDRLRKADVPLCQLDFKFLSDFEYFLRAYRPVDHQKPMGNNTVMKHIERLRKVVTMGVNLDWIEKDPFTRFRKRVDKVDRGFLTSEELVAIENKSFGIERIRLVRDLFIFSCYTGLAYQDVMLLTPDQVVNGIDGKKWISTKRVKTSIQVNIPILPKAMEIIELYSRHPKAINKGTLLPTISNQKLNSYLKEIADLCGITKNLTFHLARHTFATTVTLTNGVPIETVSKLLGHTSIRTTQVYARIVETKLSHDMEVLSEKLTRKHPDPEKIRRIV